jgi:hypothetical protein
MKTETIPALVVINDFILNFNSISYFQHGYDQNSVQHFIKFKMVCGDYVNFDFKNEDEYKNILDNLFHFYIENGGKKWVSKNIEKTPKKLKILPKNDKK